MFEAFVRNGLLVTVGTLIVTVLAVVAAFRIPVQMIPDLEIRTISIRTSWPGATPQDIEKEILIEQEEYLRNIPNLQRLEATATRGQARVELDFPFGTDITETLILVNNALNQVPAYPENVDEPSIAATSFSANSFMFFGVGPLPGNPRGLDMDMMRDFVVDNVRPRLASVPGVSNIDIGGGAERQVQIMVDPARLADRRLTITDVRSALQRRNRDVSGGEVESGKRRYLLRTVGRFDDLAGISELILARRGDDLIRLGDVATVRLDHFEVRQLASLNDKPIMFVGVRREAGSNVIDIKRAMLPAVDRINRDILNPAGLEMVPIADDVTYVQSSLRNVWLNLGLGALLATGVMYLFLRSLPVTAIAVMGIPLCSVAAFLGLLAAGRTINVISLAGIAFAIGMTLDNSIVVIESIELERRRGLDRIRAAVDGVRSVGGAVLASTLTTILVFAPVLFIREEAGQLYSDVAIAISASILVSMLIATMLLPAAAARADFAGQDATAGAQSSRTRERILGWISGCLASRRRQLTTIVVAVLASLGLAIALMPPAEYLPEGEEPKVFAMMNAPPGYNLSAMADVGADLRAYFLPFVGADPEDFGRGDAAVPALKYLNLRIEAEGLRIISEPLNVSDADALLRIITEKYRTYPGMSAFAARGSIITSNDGGTRSVNVDIAGPDLETIYKTATSVYLRSEQVLDQPRIQSQPRSLTLTQPLVEVRPAWERLAELGISAEELGYSVAVLTDGAYVDEFFLGDDKIDIFLYGPAGAGTTLDAVGEQPVFTPAGVTLPLNALAEIRETIDTSTVRRVDGQRTVTLNIIPPESIPLETGVAIIRFDVLEHLRATGAIPATVSLTLSGASDQLSATQSALSGNYSVALLIIYLLLVAIFRHWGYPMLIMATIPLGIAGGIVGLALLNGAGALLGAVGLGGFYQPFDMISMLGFLILMGTVVNNPILIVDRALQNLKDGAESAHKAVEEAVAVRLRPIAISTLTTICGLSPLVFLPGAGTELYRGVGAIVLFGILGAAIISLTVLPALTIIVLEWRRGREGVVGKA